MQHPQSSTTQCFCTLRRLQDTTVKTTHMPYGQLSLMMG